MQRAMRNGLAHFGPVDGRTMLDLGCGAGHSAIFFAERGANVIAVDTSATAVRTLNERAESIGLSNLRAVVADALDIEQFGPVDAIYGSMILHHVEPFVDFAGVLSRTLKPTGRAFFYENSAGSRLLMWCRTHLAGRYGIPKLGDPKETPLSTDEIDRLRHHFYVETVIPDIYFFGLLSTYLFRGHGVRFFKALDDLAYRHIPPMRSLSYRQYVYLSRGHLSSVSVVP